MSTRDSAISNEVINLWRYLAALVVPLPAIALLSWTLLLHGAFGAGIHPLLLIVFAPIVHGVLWLILCMTHGLFSLRTALACCVASIAIATASGLDVLAACSCVAVAAADCGLMYLICRCGYRASIRRAPGDLW